HRLLPARRYSGGDRCSAGGWRVSGLAAGRSPGAAHSNKIRRLSSGWDNAVPRRSPVRAPVHGRLRMSHLREPGFDRVVALVLRVGAFGCFFIMLAGLLIGLFVPGRVPGEVERAGVLLMLATPVVRVAVAGVLFLREKDWKYGAISLGVLTILLLSAVFGIGEH